MNAAAVLPSRRRQLSVHSGHEFTGGLKWQEKLSQAWLPLLDFSLVYLKGDSIISRNVVHKPESARRLVFICSSLAMMPKGNKMTFTYIHAATI